MKYIINNINKNKTKKDFEDDLKSIHKISKGKDIDDLSIDEMNRLVFLHERSALSYRRLLEHLEKNDANTRLSPNKSCDICNFDSTHFDTNRPITAKILQVDGQNMIHIFSPFMFKRGLSESFLLAQYLNLSLKTDVKDHQMLKGLFTNQKVIVHVIRCAKRFNPQAHCDNDNLEISELINTLFSDLMISDSPLKTSFMSDFVLVESEDEEGMHVIVAPYSLEIYGEKLLNMVSKTP